MLKAPDVTEAVQRRALEVFKSARRKSSVRGLAEALFNSNDLPVEIADAVCAAGGPDELALWLALPGRTADQIVSRLKKERRVKVLSSVADRDDLPGEVFENLVNASRNPKVLAKVCGNESVPEEVRVAAALRGINSVATSSQSGWTRKDRLSSVLAPLPGELRDKALVQVDNKFVLFSAASTHGVSPELAAHLYPMVLESSETGRQEFQEAADAVRDSQSGHHSFYGAYEKSWWPVSFLPVVTEMANSGSLTPEQTGNLTKALTSYLEAVKDYNAAMSKNSRYYGTRDFAGEFDNAIEALNVSSGSAEPILESYTEEELLLRAQEIAAISAPRSPLAFQVIVHSSATMEITELVYSKAVYTYDMAGEALKDMFRNGRYDYAARLILNVRFTNIWDLGSYVSAADDVTAAITSLIRVLAEDPFGYYQAWAWKAIFESGLVTDEVLWEIPVDAFARLDSWDATTASTVTRMLSELLGDDAAVWSVFETLVNDGGITLREAAETAVIL